MPSARRVIFASCAATAALLAPTSALARVDAVASARPVGDPALLRSRELWATIDVCDTSQQQDTIGIRGSMPGDGRARDRMYMRFELERLSAVNQWVEEAHSAFSLLGSAAKGLQAGVSFTPIKPKGTWRGVVEFKWMRGKTIVQTANEPTTAAHEATAGAEPTGYSAGTCVIGQ